MHGMSNFQTLFFTGDILQISDYSGDFHESRLDEAKEIVLIAAGTGMYVYMYTCDNKIEITC